MRKRPPAITQDKECIHQLFEAQVVSTPDAVAVVFEQRRLTYHEQHRLLGDETDPDSLLAAQVAYWTDALAGLPGQLVLPTDRPRPAVASYHGDYLTVRLEATLHQGLVRLGHQGGATLFMVLQAGLAALLSRLGAGSDIPLGSPIAGRTDQALDELVGSFVNTLVLRTDTSGDPTFAQLLARVRETALAAYAHQDVPFEYLVEVLNPTRSLAHHPLFQIMLALQNAPEADFDLTGLDIRFVPAPTATARFDLSFSLSERRGEDGAPEGIDGAVEYACDLFDPATVEALLARWTRLLEAAVGDPHLPIGRIDILSTEERARLLVHYNNTATPIPPARLPALFETQVKVTPQAVAVVFGDTTLTYEQLNAQANRLAHALIARGVGRESAVAMLLERSVDLVVSILAVVKAGGTYVPLDTRYPLSRMGLIMEETGASVLLTDQALAAHDFPHRADVVIVDANPTEEDPGDPGIACDPEQLAYVMYTSGSTGAPKGIEITHRDVAGLALDPCWQGGNQKRVLLHSPSAFDASTYELWVPLLGGGQIVVAPAGELDLRTLERVIIQEKITSVFLTTALFNLMAEQYPGCFARVREVWTGGEMVSPPAIQRVLDVCLETIVAHVYGPTETTTFATYHAMRPPYRVQSTVPIGRPMANTRVYVLDAGLQPVPPGWRASCISPGQGWRGVILAGQG